MKAGNLSFLWQGIQSCVNLKGAKFSYSLVKNSKLVAKEMDIFTSNLSKLQIEHAIKDEAGKPVIKDNNYVMADIEAFNKAYTELANADIDIQFHKISETDLPSDITPKQLSGIFELLNVE